MQQRLVLAGALVGFEHLLPVVCRQADADRAAGQPIGVVGVRRDQRAAGGQLTPPAEGAVGTGQQCQTLTLRAQQCVDTLRAGRAAVAQAGARGGQALLGECQRNQAAGGLLGATVRVLDQVIGHAGELAGRVADHTQTRVARIGGQAQRQARALQLRERNDVFAVRQPAGGIQLERCLQTIRHGIALLQLSIDDARLQRRDRRAQVVGTALERHALVDVQAGARDDPVGGDVFVGLVEGDHVQTRLIAFAEALRASPLQVQRLVGADARGALADDAIRRAGGRHCAHGDAPTRQRIRHLEGHACTTICIGLQIGDPRGSVLLVTARALQHLHAALVMTAVGAARLARQRSERQVIADEALARRGAHAVAARVVEEVDDAGRHFGLQHVDHLVDHRHGQVGRHRLARQRAGQVQRDGLARGIDGLVSVHGQVQRRLRNDDAGVLEHHVAIAHVQHRERHVRRKVGTDLDARTVLRGRDLFQAEPVAGLAEQRVALDLVALEREQCVVHRQREGDQRLGRVANLVTVAVEHHFDVAGHSLHAIAGHPVARCGEQVAGSITHRQRVGARLVELDRESRVALGIRSQRAFGAGARFQAHQIPLGRRRTCTGPTACTTHDRHRRQVERHVLTRRREVRRGRQLVRRGTARDQQLTRDLHAVGRAVVGEHGHHVTARLLGRRQVQLGIAVAVGGQFLLLQLDGEQAGVTQFALHHRHLLRTQADRHLAVLDRLAVRIAQADLALDRFARAVAGLVQRQVHVKVRLDVFGHAESAAVGAAVVVEAQRVAAGRCVGRQRKARIGTGLASQARGGRGHRCAVRVEHLQLDVARRRHGRFGSVLEVATDELDAHFVARAIQRAISEGVQLGVVDLAVVVEILGDEHAARAIVADHVATLR